MPDGRILIAAALAAALWFGAIKPAVDGVKWVGHHLKLSIVRLLHPHRSGEPEASTPPLALPAGLAELPKQFLVDHRCWKQTEFTNRSGQAVIRYACPANFSPYGAYWIEFDPATWKVLKITY